MPWIAIPCPRCNSPQLFKPRYKPMPDKAFNYAYIKCDKCYYEKELDIVSDVQLATMRRRKRNERINNKKKEAAEARRGKGSI